MNVDTAFDALKRIVPEIRSALSDKPNEAAHRLHAVDRILKEVLGWPAQAIYPEEHAAEGRVDYLLRVEDANRAVVEAKSSDTLWFDTPHATDAFKVNGPVFARPETTSAINQASGYAQSKRVALACVTNGLDWIVFQGNRIDGKDVEDGKAYLFQGLDAVIHRFNLFYSLLSYDNVLSLVWRGLFDEVERLAPRNFSFSRALLPPDQVGTFARGNHAADLAAVCQRFFRDVTGDRDPELLFAAFVDTKESRSAEDRLERITRELATSITQVDASADNLKDTVSTAVESEGSEQVLIVGLKGSGKSTFVARFFQCKLPKDIRERCCVLTLDLGSYSGSTSGIQDWLHEELIAQLDRELESRREQDFDHLRGMFWSEYQRMKATTLSHLYDSNPEAFRAQFGAHIEDMRTKHPFAYAATIVGSISRAQKRLPVIVFDNADHFSAEVQDAAFQYGAAVAKHREVQRCLVIVPITERTLWAKQADSAFASHFSTRFYLPSPPPRRVIAKRLECAAERIKRDKEKSGEYRFSASMRLSFEDLYKAVGALQYVLLNHERLGDVITNLSNGNIRSSFDIFRGIITSGHLRLDQIIAAYASGDPEAIPKASLMKALIKGEFDEYRADSNVYVANVFNLAPKDFASPLLGVRILWQLRLRYLEAASRRRPMDADYHIPDLVQFFLQTSAERRAISSVVDSMLARELVEADDPSQTRMDECKSIRITPRGRQHLQWVRGEPIYLESMAVTAEIHDPDTLDDLRAAHFARPPDFHAIQKTFAEYCAVQDTSTVSVPGGAAYDEQRMVSDYFRRRWIVDAGGVAGKGPS